MVDKSTEGIRKEMTEEEKAIYRHEFLKTMRDLGKLKL